MSEKFEPILIITTIRMVAPDQRLLTRLTCKIDLNVVERDSPLGQYHGDVHGEPMLGAALLRAVRAGITSLIEKLEALEHTH